MPAITLTEAFGANATLAAGTLTITIADLASNGLNGPTPTAPEILTAILLRLKGTQPSNALEDAERGIVIGDPFKTISRNETQLEYQYPYSVFVPINIPALDPDDVVG